MTDTDIREQTLALFGPELGSKVLTNGAVLPVRANKRPAAGIRGYNNGVDLSAPFGPYDGLAVVNGPLSGIVAVDIDRQDLQPPVDFNVRTSKGGHIWIPWQEERRQPNFIPGVDILGTGGYSIFTGPGKEFISPIFADRDLVMDWLASLSTQSRKTTATASTSTSTSTSTLKRAGTGNGARASVQSIVPESETRECVYWEKLAALGFELKVDTITQTYVSQMRNTAEGARNIMCHRYALEVYRCGGDLDAFAQAAIDSGLAPEEVRATISQARADIDFDYRPEVEIYERVQVWLKAHEDIFRGVMLDVANEVAYEAIVTNSTRPLVSQMRTAKNIGRDRAYVGQVLKIMQNKHKALRFHPNPGTWGGGRTHCHNYELTVYGEVI